MRTHRHVALFTIIIFLFTLPGCGSAAALPVVLKGRGVSVDAASGLKAEIRYLAESKGVNYMYAELAEDMEALRSLLSSVAAGKPAKKPDDAQYTPELRCDCEIVISGGSGESVSLYYDTKRNLLVFPEDRKEKNKNIIIYQYFTPDGKLADLISAQHSNARLKEDNTVKPFRNLEELKASIDPEELAEAGEELDFEFFSGATPEYAGTACSVYTTAGFAAVPQESCLITAYGKSTAGQQQKLSVIGFEANTHYTKILVTQPDDALDSVDTGEESPDSYAIVVKLSALDAKKWLVFVDEANRVLDVILPEDIEGLDTAQSPTAAPGATATPEPDGEEDAID